MVPRKPVPQTLKYASPPYPVTPTEEEGSNLREQYFTSVFTSQEPSSIRITASSEQRRSLTSKNLSQLDLPPSLRVGPDGIPLDKLQEKFSGKQSNKYYPRKNSIGCSTEEKNEEDWDTSDLEKSIISSLEPSSKLLPQAGKQNFLYEVVATSNNYADIKPPRKQEPDPSFSSPSSTETGSTSDGKFIVISHESSPNLTVNDPICVAGDAANSQPNTTPPTRKIIQCQAPDQKESDLSKIYELSADSTYISAKVPSQTRNAMDEIQDTLSNISVNPRSPRDSIHIDKASTSINSQSRIIPEKDNPLTQAFSENYAPPLPPRSQEKNMSQSRRFSTVESRKKKTEMYNIKKISVLDINVPKNLKITPILVQNANGPCPLLALVNALTLSTPSHLNTPLIETLRSREQISLGLLLDAVFDELMSGRRSDASSELPDVTDLYSFLLSLHSGMNVNPCFVTASDKSAIKTLDPTSREHLPEIGGAPLPGNFEKTREMCLYSAFNIPLIHGWIPQPDSPEYFALSRSAKTYEDAQNMMLREEALECKFSREGLSSEEQSLLKDISITKNFLSFNATQLTRYGLSTITTSLAPGSVAIFFRNDHFSTLYRQPKTLKLLQLVTDMGYAKHDEIVWESLVDVTGENSEFFSGDFRLVTDAVASSSAKPPTNNHSATRPLSSIAITLRNDMLESRNIEQEDHDLALALQIQEEEEQEARRHRQLQSDVESRQQITSTNTLESRPEIPPRRSNVTLNNLQDLQSESAASYPPPSYEVAATQEAYIPPADSPLPAQGNSPHTQTQALPSRVGNIRHNKWQKRVNYELGNGLDKRDRECVIM
ncbi:hypothetical protein K3495_g9164 [Podosphaera aphanis]|nr:hypothetical protein K3495_g9164 [Podosphaera aphanis]